MVHKAVSRQHCSGAPGYVHTQKRCRPGPQSLPFCRVGRGRAVVLDSESGSEANGSRDESGDDSRESEATSEQSEEEESEEEESEEEYSSDEYCGESDSNDESEQGNEDGGSSSSEDVGRRSAPKQQQVTILPALTAVLPNMRADDLRGLLLPTTISTTPSRVVPRLAAGAQQQPATPSVSCVPATPAAFKRQRQSLVQELFQQYNREVFGGRLPTDLSITWNARLLTTAGLTHYKREFIQEEGQPFRWGRQGEQVLAFCASIGGGGGVGPGSHAFTS